MNSPGIVWQPPPEELAIMPGQVHVWRAALELKESDLERLSPLLSGDELIRADRFYFRKDRNRFIASHACVRDILARYINVKPIELQFQANSYGKPSLSDHSELNFNLSHSHGFALVAVTCGQPVGVDIERIRPDMAGEEIARRFFSPREVEVLLSLPPERRSLAFFSCWTRKEAYIKARGLGLSLPLNEFDVSVLPEEPAALLMNRADPTEVSRWSMYRLDPAPGYAGAVAVPAPAMELSLWEWNPPV